MVAWWVVVLLCAYVAGVTWYLQRKEAVLVAILWPIFMFIAICWIIALHFGWTDLNW